MLLLLLSMLLLVVVVVESENLASLAGAELLMVLSSKIINVEIGTKSVVAVGEVLSSKRSIKFLTLNVMLALRLGLILLDIRSIYS